MIEKLINWYIEVLTETGWSESLLIFLENLTVVIVTIVLALVADLLTKRILLTTIKRIVKRTKNEWDDIFVTQHVFDRLAHIAPALVVYGALQYIFDAENLVTFLRNLTQTYMIVVVVLVLDATLNALYTIYCRFPVSEGRNIKGLVQVVKILIYFVAVILIISVFSGKPPNALIASLGALAAVLILVFKDTILGLVASIQLSANRMVNLGDWIAMPKYGADGDVVDINLTSVKVQNWDKTIATIPTYALVTESFNNWKGMEESGGRRIKRSVHIDMNSVAFLNEDQLELLRKFHLLKDYLKGKEAELKAYNDEIVASESTVTNGRRLTNLGTFRAYLEAYLHAHPKIHQDMTFLVRHLQPTDKGLPIEIYVFSNDQAWANYESIQADIMDHVLAILPEFGLRVYQSPTGGDFQRLASGS